MKGYLFRKNISIKAFAADIGISAAYLYQILRGERTPSYQLAQKIEKYTDGEVLVKNLLGKHLCKETSQYEVLDIRHEFETHRKLLSVLETYNKNLKSRMESVERQLSELKRKRDAGKR